MCVCVCVRERECERDRVGERVRDRESVRERERERERERGWTVLCQSVLCQTVLGRCLTQLGSLLQEGDHHGGVAAADGAVQGTHATVVHVLDHGTTLYQEVHL